MRKSINKFPKGWTGNRIRALAAHYEQQSDAKAAAEDNAAYRDRGHTMMSVPVSLVPKVQRLIASAHRPRRRSGKRVV